MGLLIYMFLANLHIFQFYFCTFLRQLNSKMLLIRLKLHLLKYKISTGLCLLESYQSPLHSPQPSGEVVKDMLNLFNFIYEFQLGFNSDQTQASWFQLALQKKAMGPTTIYDLI